MKPIVESNEPQVLHSPAEMAVVIKNYQTIFIGAFCNEPQTLVKWFMQEASTLPKMTLYTIITGSPLVYVENLPQQITVKTFLSSGAYRKLEKTNQVDYIPMNLSEIPHWLEDEKKIDVAFIQVGPMNEEGYYNVGISVDVIPQLLNSAKIVIAEINDALPIAKGQTSIHNSRISYILSSERQLIMIEDKEGSQIEKKIAEHVATLVPNGATIQIGIGSLSNEIAKALVHKKDLGIHSGSLNSGMKYLIEKQVVTNAKKKINRNKTVITTVLGDTKLYEFINNNDAIELMPVSYTHDPKIISQLEKFYAINSAIEVDLSGQINAETIQTSLVAGVGGQMDFMVGARLSKSGCRIIALPATAKGNTVSKIKVSINVVTSLKSEVDYLVTEFGIAKLKGRSIFERQRAIINIAHPNFREQLLKDSLIASREEI